MIGVSFEQTADGNGAMMRADIPFSAYVTLTHPPEPPIRGMELGDDLVGPAALLPGAPAVQVAPTVFGREKRLSR